MGRDGGYLGHPFLGSQSHEEDQSVSAADDQGGHGPRALRKMQRRSGQPPRSADRASFAATKDVSCPWGVLRRPISVLRFPSDAPQRCQTTRDRPGPGYQPGPFSCVTCTGELASNARFPPASGSSRFAFRTPYVYRRSENFASDFGYRRHGPRSCGTAIPGDWRVLRTCSAMPRGRPESLPCLAVSSIHQSCVSHGRSSSRLGDVFLAFKTRDCEDFAGHTGTRPIPVLFSDRSPIDKASHYSVNQEV